MSKLTKRIATIGLAVMVAVSMTGTASAALTESQIQSILNLLQSFGADSATVTNVESALRGQPVAVGPSPAGACNFTRDLTLNVTGDDVKCLQQYLNAAGYPVASTGAGSPGNETTFFGPLTRAAVAKWQAANNISPAVGYFGPISRAKYNELAGAAPAAPQVPGVAVPATGLAVSLAADTPGEAAVPKSAANVPFLKFHIAGNGTVSNITLKRVGAGSTSDFDNVYLYDGATRLTSGRSVNSSTHEVNFTSLDLAVSGVKTLTVTADIASGAGAADRNGFQVTSVVADVAVSGVPIQGNQLTISSGTAGTITIEKASSLSNPNIGQSGALVSVFRLTPSNEDANVKRISLFYAGSLSKSNLSNFVLKDFVTGDTLATTNSITAKDLVVFEFTSPLTILKGENKLFSVYADISGSAKKDDTIKLYIDEASDVFATGAQFGYGMGVTKTSFDSDPTHHHVLTLQGAEFTITLNGPNASDIARRGKDVTLFDFNLAAASTVEVRRITFSIATTGIAGDDGDLEDVKLVDITSGVTVAGPKDVATSSFGSFNFTDIFTVNAGQSRRLKLTADIPSTWDDSDSVTVTLKSFVGDSDLKNLENNQFLGITEISPSTDIAGNKQTVKAPTLDVALAGSPVSQSFVKGSQNVPILGISLRAVADNIKVTTIKLTSSQTSGTDPYDKNELTSLRLFDGTTQVGNVESLTGSTAPYTATFDNLSFVIPKGATKVLTVKGNISSAATSGNVYSLMIVDVADTTGEDIVAVDSEGNEPVYQVAGTNTSSAGNSINGANTVKITGLSSGSMDVAQAPSDSESKAGIILANSSKVTLAKFNFTANNEALTVKKLRVVLDTDDATQTASAGVSDEVTRIYLFDSNNNVIGDSAGYAVPSVERVSIENLSWVVPKDETKTLVIKGDTNTIDAGADTGTEVRAHIHNGGFEASGAATTITTFNSSSAPNSDDYAALGREKVVYKTKPTVSQTSLASTLLNAPTDLEVARFTVAADSKEQIAWGAIGIEMTLLNASFSDVAFTVRDITNSVDLTVGTQAPTSSSLDLTADTTKSAIIYLSTPEQISAGASRTYAVKINATAAQFGTSGETETLTSRLILHNDSSAANIANAATFSFSNSTRVDATLDSADNAFVWSDFSLPGAEDADADWANGVYVDTFPSTPAWILTRTN